MAGEWICSFAAPCERMFDEYCFVFFVCCFACADSSFMSLLNKLAHLEFPNRSTPEQCPCCPELFPLEEFAAHVYKCIQVRHTKLGRCHVASK